MYQASILPIFKAFTIYPAKPTVGSLFASSSHYLPECVVQFSVWLSRPAVLPGNSKQNSNPHPYVETLEWPRNKDKAIPTNLRNKIANTDKVMLCYVMLDSCVYNIQE